jgi:hypothetical protein
MKSHLRKAILVATAALAVGAMPAPAYAVVETDHCLEPPYSESVPYCACVAVGQVSNIVFPGAWGCSKP